MCVFNNYFQNCTLIFITEIIKTYTTATENTTLLVINIINSIIMLSLQMSLSKWLHRKELYKEHQRLRGPVSTRCALHRSRQRLSLFLHTRIFQQGLWHRHWRVRLETVSERWWMQRSRECLRVRLSSRLYGLSVRDWSRSLQSKPVQKFGPVFQYANRLLLSLSWTVAR